MQLIKDNFWPTMIIFMAAFAVIFAFWPLENSSWADGFRVAEMQEEASIGGGDEGVGGEDGPGRLTGLAMLLPMIKVALLMGIGVLFTAIGSGIGRLLVRFRTASPT